MSVTDDRRDAILQNLDCEFASLDTTLVRAIAADYDLLANIDELRVVLLALSSETQNDDYDNTFDPSGMGGITANSTAQDDTDPSTFQSKDTSQESELMTRISSSEGSSNIEDNAQYQAVMASLMQLDDEEKMRNLLDFFPNEPAARIEFLLKKSHGDFTKALDTLLNQTFMASENPMKGVDAFLEERAFTSKKKNKKGRGRKNSGESSRITIGVSAYKQSDAEIETVPTKSSKFGRTSTKSPGYLQVQSSSSSSNNYSGLSSASAAEVSSAWTEYTHKGNATYRNSNLGRFAGAVASHYHSEANAKRQAFDHLSKGEADRLVSATATKTQIDLHGVTVDHATRIAVTRTRKWWDEIDDEHKYKAHLRGQNEFRIITGIGNHSVGGVGKLGPAVYKRLVAEGWKVFVGTGYVCVTGSLRSK